MIGICRLCKNKKTLKESHIVPKMFYNYIKKHSKTKIMRQVANPNVGVQDGVKTPFLCNECEELFSKYETAFSNKVYQLTVSQNGWIDYDSSDDEIAYFLLSISWRVMKYVMEKDKPTFTEKEIQKIEETLELWRMWLYNEEIKKIRSVQQFIIPTIKLDFFENMPFRVKDNVMMDFKTFDREDDFKHSFTIVQVPYYIFITSVWGKTNDMKQYRIGTKIKPHNGTLPKKITQLLYSKHYTEYIRAYEKLSEKQKKIIEERNGKNLL